MRLPLPVHLLIALCCTASVHAVDWRSLPAPINPLCEVGNAVVDGKWYVFGSFWDHKHYDEVLRFDPVTERWSVRGALPPVHPENNHFTMGNSVYRGEVYMVGGKSDYEGRHGQLWIYKPSSNSWRRGPDMPEASWGGPSVVIGSKLHLLTGAHKGKTSTSQHHFVLDLTNMSKGWSSLAQVPKARVHAAAVAYRGKIWLLGGEASHTHKSDTATVQVYDPASNRWDLSKPALPKKRSHAEWSTFVHDDKIWSCGGVDHPTQMGQREIYVYTGDTNRWSKWADMPNPYASLCAKVIGDKLYLAGGGVNDWFQPGTHMRVTTVGGTTPPPADTTPPSAPTGLTVSVR